MTSNIAILIPAYKPTAQLTRLVSEICDKHAGPVIVVDDGGGPSFAEIFRSLEGISQVEVIRNAVNLGKGAALKHGINHILNRYPECAGIVTADADGQHHVDDIVKVCDELVNRPAAFVLGYRVFGSNTPLKSKIGNNVSRVVYRGLLGLNLRDTQTGLRGISREFAAELLHIRSNRYEFETEQLTLAAKLGLEIAEVPIQTIYIDGNSGSHFNPVFDSLRIYFVVFRYALSSLLTASVDFIVFAILSTFVPGVIWANLGSRLVALGVQFALLKSFVFHTDGGMLRFAAFVGYVALTGIISGALQIQLNDWTGIDGLAAKIVVEAVIFVFNFLFLRDILFRRRAHG